MYAIVDIAGQQFKVEAGNEIFVNRLAAANGADVEFDKVLLVAGDAGVKVGTPYVDGAVVKAMPLTAPSGTSSEDSSTLPVVLGTRAKRKPVFIFSCSIG